MNSTTVRLLEQLESKFAAVAAPQPAINNKQLVALHHLHLQDQQILKTKAKHKITTTKHNYEGHILALEDRIVELENELHKTLEHAQMQEYEFQRQSEEEHAYWQRTFHDYQQACNAQFDSKLMLMKQEMDSLVEENAVLCTELNNAEMQVRRLEWEKRQLAERFEMEMQAMQRDFAYKQEQAKLARMQHQQEKLNRALEEMDI